jgi:hypothetical protein
MPSQNTLVIWFQFLVLPLLAENAAVTIRVCL